MKGRLLLCAVALTVAGAVAGLSQAASGQARGGGADDLASYDWTVVKPNTDPGPASWAPRAGLQAVELHKSVFVMGGRTSLLPLTVGVPFPIPLSIIWQDVWRSDDRGATWAQVTPEAGWPARAYFQAVTKGGEMFVLGGQNFKALPGECAPGPPPCSDFFNDVWSSRDGSDWKQVTQHAGWDARAGLSSIVHRGQIYVLGGSQNDDAATGGGPPSRTYFNDVWKSKDGRKWTRVVKHAPWTARAGAVLVEKKGWIYLLGGEEGFTCGDPTTPCTAPPYFNDVWRSRDGSDWELVTEHAGWSPRPGHQCEVLLDRFVCFGGFGLPPFGNPMDIWESKDGAAWTRVPGSPWNATLPLQVKYDFDVLVLKGGKGGERPSIYTFGGDRETFDFFDPDNYLRLDNDVWRFGPG